MSYNRLHSPAVLHQSQVPGPPPNNSMRYIFNPIYSSPGAGAGAGAPMTAVRRRKLLLSYAPDWILTIVLAALFFSLDKVNGYRRMFSLEDPSISFPFAVHERVPDLALYFICFVTPLCIMPIVNFITVRSWWDFHNSTLGLILGLSLTGSLTQVVKITVGRPRPDLLSRCQPPAGLSDPPYGLTSWTVCTQTDESMMRDGFRSFFSGHSSMSFAGMGFLAFYLAGKMHLFDTRGHASKAWLAFSPFMVASLVAISRTMDYRHHWQDVLVGSAVGIVFSFFAYRQYYPPLSSELAHRPYSPRIKREDDHTILPVHNRYPSTEHRLDNSHNRGHQYTDSVDDTFELAGTVPRPDTEPLGEMWKDRNPGSTMGIASGGSILPTAPQYPGGAVVPLRNPDMAVT